MTFIKRSKRYLITCVRADNPSFRVNGEHCYEKCAKYAAARAVKTARRLWSGIFGIYPVFGGCHWGDMVYSQRQRLDYRQDKKDPIPDKI